MSWERMFIVTLFVLYFLLPCTKPVLTPIRTCYQGGGLCRFWGWNFVYTNPKSELRFDTPRAGRWRFPDPELQNSPAELQGARSWGWTGLCRILYPLHFSWWHSGHSSRYSARFSVVKYMLRITIISILYIKFEMSILRLFWRIDTPNI